MKMNYKNAPTYTFSKKFLAIAIASLFPVTSAFSANQLQSGDGTFIDYILAVDETTSNTTISQNALYTGKDYGTASSEHPNWDGGKGLYVTSAGSTQILNELTNYGTIKGGDNDLFSGGIGLYIDNIKINTVTNEGLIRSGDSGSGDTVDAIWITNNSVIDKFINKGTLMVPESKNIGGAAMAVNYGSLVKLIENEGTIIGANTSSAALHAGVGIYFHTTNEETNLIYNKGQNSIISGGSINNENSSMPGESAIYIAKGKVNIINEGIISSGLNTSNQYNTAINFNDAFGNTLNLVSGSQINGSVYSAMWQNFILSGYANTFGVFDLTKLTGNGWDQDASTYTKLGQSTWTLSGINNINTPWLVKQGTLKIASNSTIQSQNRAIEVGYIDSGNYSLNRSGHFILLASSTVNAHVNIQNSSSIEGIGQVAGNLTVADSTVVAGKITTENLNDSGTLTVAGNVIMNGASTLDLSVKELESLNVSDTLTFNGSDNTLNLTGYDPIHVSLNDPSYTLVKTVNGISGNFNVTIAGQRLVNYVDLDHFLIGTAGIHNNDIVTHVALVWNNSEENTAHGTFKIIDNQVFELGSHVSLSNNPYITSNNLFDWDGKSLTKTGSGTLVINSTNSYTGLTDIQAGTLVIGKTASDTTVQIAGDVAIQNSATLAGHGSVTGKVIVHSGGTLTVGNGDQDFGVLSTGSVEFESGSIYQVKVNDSGKYDQLKSEDTVTIADNTTLNIQAAAGTWAQDVTYTIIDSVNDVTGTFNPVQSNLAFLTGIVDYSQSNQVNLTMVRNSSRFDSAGQTFNQKQTGNAVESLRSDNNIYKQIVSMSKDQARTAFDNLSGEIHASVKSAARLNSIYTRNAVNRHLDKGFSVFAHQQESEHGLWLSTWGHKSRIKSDGNAAQVQNSRWGTLLGLDIFQSMTNNRHTVLGIATGYDRSHIKINANRYSSAEMDAVHLLAYGQTSINNFKFKGMIDYSWLDIDTQRYINVGNITGNNKADYNGGLFQLTLETSYQLNPSETVELSPYLNLGYTRIKTDRFSETGDDSSSLTRLHHRDESDIQFNSTIGIRSLLSLSDITTFYSDLGWMHTLSRTAPQTTLSFANSDRYMIKGDKVDQNMAIIGLGVQTQLIPSMQLNIGYEGLFGNQSQNHGIQIQYDYFF